MTLLSDFRNQDATVGVIGLGYVGLPLAVRFAQAGFAVRGVDIDEEKVERINSGRTTVGDVADEELAAQTEPGRLEATTETAVLAECDAVSICVPTPLGKTREPDITHVMRALESLQPHLHEEMLLVLESTTYPGTTEELIVPMVEEAGLAPGEDVFIAFSPERVDPGNETYQIKNTPKVVGGVTERCTEAAEVLYGEAIDEVVPVSSSRTAETVKLLENTFRNINIGWANEFALICQRLGVDCWEVIEAASTKPFGFMPFYPGPGLGGHCIPIDPQYLSWKLKTLDYTTRFIALADEINNEMPLHVARLAMEALNDHGKPLKGSRVTLVGAAYKPDIDDTRESPIFRIIRELDRRGAELEYHDRHCPKITLESGEEMHSVELGRERLQSSDLVVIVTDHSYLDCDELVENAPLILDTRNALSEYERGNIVKL